MNVFRVQKTWETLSTNSFETGGNQMREGNIKDSRIEGGERYYVGCGGKYSCRNLDQHNGKCTSWGKGYKCPEESETPGTDQENNMIHSRHCINVNCKHEETAETDKDTVAPRCSTSLTDVIKNLREDVFHIKAYSENHLLEAEFMAINMRMQDLKIREQKIEMKTLKEEIRSKEKSLFREVDRLRFLILFGNIGSKKDQDWGDSKYGMVRLNFMTRMDDISVEMIEAKEANRNIIVKLDNLQKEFHVIRKEKENLTLEFHDLKEKLAKCIEETNNTSVGKEEVLSNSIILRPDTNLDFVWKVYNLTRIAETMAWTPIFSEAFYSNCYRLCLRLYVDGDNIGLYCFIMKGDNDSMLQWPMRQAVTISIVNQKTLRAHKSTTYQYDHYGRERGAFERPRTDRNYYCIGSYPFIFYSTIKAHSSIIVNDSIVVSCVLNDP